MSNSKISVYTEASSMATNDLFLIVDVSETDDADKTKNIEKQSVFSTPGPIGDDTPDIGRFGSAANYFDIDEDGVVTLVGDAERYMTIRPVAEVVYQVAHGKPTQVQQGVYLGYSFPIFAADDEELFFRERIPYRWDGASNFTFEIYCWLTGAEDVGDYFNFQASWEHHSCTGNVVPTTSNDVEVEQIILTGRSAQYSCYKLVFTIDYDIDGVGNEVASGDNFVIRLRRIAAVTGVEVDAEISVYDWKLKYTIDKLYGKW